MNNKRRFSGTMRLFSIILCLLMLINTPELTAFAADGSMSGAVCVVDNDSETADDTVCDADDDIETAACTVCNAEDGIESTEADDEKANLSGEVSENDVSAASTENIGEEEINNTDSPVIDSISTWQDLQDALIKGVGTGCEGDESHIIRLTQDITADKGDQALQFHGSDDYDVILDLCGHTVSRGLTGPVFVGHVLQVENGSLIIRDSEGSGTITGGNSTRDGGGIVIDGGTLTLEGGNVTGNKADVYGGGIIIQGGTLRQTGGSISDNTSEIGGGVYIDSGSYEVSGTPQVTGNNGPHSDAGNVYLREDAVIQVTGELTDGAKLCISTASNQTVTAGYARYHDQTLPADQYFEGDRGYSVYFNKDGEIDVESGHTMEPEWTWSEDESGVTATVSMKCIHCGEVEWTETTDKITGPGKYNDKEGGFGFRAEVTHNGKKYSDTKYVAPEYTQAVGPYIDDNGEYHSGMFDHFTLKFGGKTYFYKAGRVRPGARITPEEFADDLFIIKGEKICTYCREIGDKETVITLPKTYKGSTLKYIGDGSHPFFDPAYDSHAAVTIRTTDHETVIADNAFTDCKNLTIVGPHSCHIKYGEHNDKTGHYKVDYSDDHIFEAIDELTEWSDDYSSAVIHLQCIRESCCFVDVAIKDTTVTSEVNHGKIEYRAEGEYNGKTYTVSTQTKAYTVCLEPDNGIDKAVSISSAKIYSLPGSDVGFTTPAGTVLHGWKDKNGKEFAPGEKITLTDSRTTFTAVWSSEWEQVNTALQKGEEVTLRNNITAGENDTALSVPQGITSSLNFNGFTIDRGLSKPVENGSVFIVDGILTMDSSNTDSRANGKTAHGVITGGFNSGNGGGILVSGTGNVAVRHIDIRQNQSGNGAGVHLNPGGTASVSGSNITNNTAANHGGGAYVSENASLSVEPGSQIIDNVAEEGAGVYIEDGGTSSFTGPNVKVKNNHDRDGVYKNIHAENYLAASAPVVIGGSMAGVCLCFSAAAGSKGAAAFILTTIAVVGIIAIACLIVDVCSQKDIPDQEAPKCKHPSRHDEWRWSDDYTKADALLICDICGNIAEATDNNPQKTVGEDQVTTYTAQVEYEEQTLKSNGKLIYTSKRKVDPYIITLYPGTCSIADPVVHRVPHDKNESGTFILNVPVTFIPYTPAMPDRWQNVLTSKKRYIGEIIDVEEDETYNLLWKRAIKATYTKGSREASGDDYEEVAEARQKYFLKGCKFTRENYDFTKWRVSDGVEYKDMAAWSSFKPKSDFVAAALWQSKWTTLSNKMKDEKKNEINIDLKEDVIAQKEDTELLVPADKTVTLNMNGFTLDRNLDKAVSDGCVIRVKGTLILKGTGTLKGGFSTDSASGIILEKGGNLKISGALNITENGKKKNGDASDGEESDNGKNVYVPKDATIEVTGALDNAKIGITTEQKPEGGSPVVFTKALKGNGDMDNFVSDVDSYTVSLDKDGEAILDVQSATFKGVTGSFNENICMNFYFDLTDTILKDKDAYVILTNKNTGKEVKLLIKDTKKIKDKGYKFSIPLVAKEASDTIVAKIYDGQGNPLSIAGQLKGDDNGAKTDIQYTLMKYFDWLKDHGSDKEKAVGAAAKDYCSAAQIYFDYNTEGVSVSSAVDAVTEAELIEYIPKSIGTLPEGVSIKAMTTELKTDNTLRLYLNFEDVDPSKLKYTIDGDIVNIKKRSDGAHYLALDAGTYPNHLQDAHNYSVSDGKTTFTYRVSVMSYARSLSLRDSKVISDLGKSMYLYNQAARRLFGE